MWFVMVKRSGIRHFWRSFSGHMIIGLLAIQIVLTPVLFYGILQFIERGFQSQFVDQVRNNTFLYGALLELAVLEQNEPKQVAILNEAFLNEDLIQAEFVHPDGRVIRPTPFEGLKDVSFEEDFKYGEHEDHVYYIDIPLLNDFNAERLGSLRLGYDERPTQERISVAYGYGLVLVAGYALLSIMIAIFFGRRLVRPISQLQNMARSIATGDTAIGLNVSTKILEISDLATDLDTMRQTLVNQNRDVKDREQKLYALLDNAGEGIISINDNGVIDLFNQAAELMFGYTASQVLGKNVSIFLPPSDLKNHDRDIQNYLTTGEARIIGKGQRLKARHQDGHLFPVHLTVTEIELDDKQIFMGIIRDLTQEEQREQQLLQTWRVVEQSPVSIIITNATGTIEYVNPHFCEVTGYQADEVFGANTNILKSGHTDTDTYDDLWNTISSGEIWRGEFQNKKKNGESFWESATICPVHDHNNKITHYVALKEDITERREKDRMLSQAMKLEVVGRMTDGIAHDFNNLLTIILGNLQYLADDLRKDERDEEMELVADAMSAAHDGSNLIKQLLVFSRRAEPDSKPMEIAAFMESTQRLLKRTVPEDIAMKLEITEDTGTVLIDSNRLESAILNLVINARDAMPGGGEIVISIEKAALAKSEMVAGGSVAPGNYVFIKIADNGTGMSEKVRQQALEPFFTTKTSATGTGLGLSMVADLISQSGGGIQIESELGKGTTVTLILPLYDQPAESLAEVEETRDQLPGGKETILLVEDRERVRRFAGRVLGRLGYTLIEAGNAAEAVEHLKTNDGIDLLFSDIVMPGDMNGRALADYASSRKSTLKILLTTGMESRTEKGGNGGAEFPLLRKPYSAEQLALAIRSVLETSKTDRE